MEPQVHWPEWWEWELDVSRHARRRMVKREFSETDLRVMLTDARSYCRAEDPDRFLIQTKWHGRPWVVVVEPDAIQTILVVVTAYEVE
jgi:hypothetical protein